MYKPIKRLLDIVGSGILLLILTPILVPLMIALKLTGEHYIFYKQERLGLRKSRFNILKFATMLKDSPNMGTGLITLRNDPRLTPLGGFLRKSKINELPQLINVLLGEMSFVGPRPLVDKTFNALPKDRRDQVYDSKPGITGIGSVVFRDEEVWYNEFDMSPEQVYQEIIGPLKADLEIWYSKNKSLYVDAVIVFLTALVIIAPQSNLVYSFFPNLPKKENYILVNKVLSVS
jgi:lipopolysaccharide/colanic/teichoic acid biosynthesis glycosyltransferase